MNKIALRQALANMAAARPDLAPHVSAVLEGLKPRTAAGRCDTLGSFWEEYNKDLLDRCKELGGKYFNIIVYHRDRAYPTGRGLVGYFRHEEDDGIYPCEVAVWLDCDKQEYVVEAVTGASGSLRIPVDCWTSAAVLGQHVTKAMMRIVRH